MGSGRGLATTNKLLGIAALSASAALGGQARAEAPAAMKAEGGVLVCKVGNSKSPKYAECTPAQIDTNAKALARALLAAKPTAASLPAAERYAACKIGNSKGPMYDDRCTSAMQAVYDAAKSGS